MLLLLKKLENPSVSVPLNANHYENTPIQICRKFHVKTERRGGSNEYSQYMFLNRNNKNNVYPCKPHIKVRFKGGQNYIGMFS